MIWVVLFQHNAASKRTNPLALYVVSSQCLWNAKALRTFLVSGLKNLFHSRFHQNHREVLHVVSSFITTLFSILFLNEILLKSPCFGRSFAVHYSDVPLYQVSLTTARMFPIYSLLCWFTNNAQFSNDIYSCRSLSKIVPSSFFVFM